MASTDTSQPPIVQTVSDKLIRPLSDFLHKEASAGILLVMAAVVAMIWANSPFSDSYFHLWSTEAVLGIGDFEIALNLKEWINDAAMVLFFFVVGLEIKRELTQGELRDPRQAALPIIAAVGGMVVPAGLYAVLNAGGEGASGWGIPMATDIAIVMGVVALLGSRAPSWLKLFLLALAIVDDIGAILVIAIFYSEGVSFGWLAIAIAAVAVAALSRSTINWIGVYIILGVICWLGLHEAHIHPTLAGVAFGMMAPVRPFRNSDMVDADELAENPTVTNALRVSEQAKATVSVVEWLEHKLHPYSAFMVVPIFALANAGIRIPTNEIGAAMSDPVTWGVILGLVVGKTVGVTAFTLIAVAFKVGSLPPGVTPRYVLGAGALAGIGFTVSLFVTELAFGEEAVGTDARLGVLIASLLAALIGTAILVPGELVDDKSMSGHGPD
ncbi:MAG: Na+/H+ antiporter NhaA [Ilumatobacteraceae bacterium]